MICFEIKSTQDNIEYKIKYAYVDDNSKNYDALHNNIFYVTWSSHFSLYWTIVCTKIICNSKINLYQQ